MRLVPEAWFGRTSAPTTRYVATLMEEPGDDDVRWLTSVAVHGDSDRARWELRYLRRALGMVVAQRDALDDRTASAVARGLREAMQGDRNVAPAMLAVSERQFNDRLGSYRDMLALKGQRSTPEERAGRTLLLLAETGRMQAEDLSRATALCGQYLQDLRTALRAAFGEPRPNG